MTPERTAIAKTDTPARVADGFEIVLSGMISHHTTFTLHVAGEYGAREVANLIRILTLQAEIVRAAELPKD
jgi:hypothetical protein